MSARLVLEDGASFEGFSIGVEGERIGEVVLNTAVVGYQELMTDPTNAGKILVLTYPLIGNYGVAGKFCESAACRAGAVVIRELTRIESNWQSEGSFSGFLKDSKAVAVSGVDTRTLAVAIRDGGERLGIVSTSGEEKDVLLARLKAFRESGKKPAFVRQVSTPDVKPLNAGAAGPKIGVLDLGVARGFLRQLETLGCRVTLFPFDTKAEALLAAELDGLIVSNGPEDDEAMPAVVETVRGVLGKVPLLGISTGFEAVGLALGGKLYRLKPGHHGVNYPVRSPASFKGDITVQNHSFGLDPASVAGRKDVSVTLRNVNDDSIEEMESASLRFLATQYYPASPGFDEVHPAFKRFLAMAGTRGGN